MNDLLQFLFGLEELGFGQEGVYIGWARPLPGWAWTLIACGAVAAASWSYWRLDADVRWRTVLAGMRAALIMLLAILFSGPHLVRPNIVIEPDWVIVLLDRSQSMQIRDVGEGTRQTREEQLESIVRESWPMWSSLTDDRRVVWLGFDSGAFDLPVGETVELGSPDGMRTSLADALDQALRRAAARPVSAVVVMSDGRSIDRPSRQALRRLEAERIPVFSVPLGRDDPLADLALDRVTAPRMAFVEDQIPVDVQVRRLGGERWPSARVQLIDRPTGIVLDEAPVEADDEDLATVMLRVRPDESGDRSWQVRVVTDQPDLVESNNEVAIGIELVDRPLRVLYLDGYPRWDQRYVKNLLLRERSIESSAMLVAANRRYLQEGDRLLDAVPRSPEEWAAFDVVIIGDVRADLFSTDQLEQLREHVAVRGAGLLWIAGPGATPSSWRATPLGDLIPFRIGARAGVTAYDGPVTMQRTEDAARLGLLGLSEDGVQWPDVLSDPRTGWSRLWYAQRIDAAALKPAAQVLAHAVPSRGALGAEGGEPTPLVVSMRYGAGRVIYVGTDEIWRWRFGRGETIPERFWLPLIRLQGRESLARGGASAILEATPDRGVVGEPIRVGVRILDESLLETRPRSVRVRVRLIDDPDEPVRELQLSPDESTTEGLGRMFSATWLAPAAGRYELEVADAILSGMDLTTQIEVLLRDDELRRPEADHTLLASLSTQTGGTLLAAGELAGLPELLPVRRTEISGEPDIETLWDRPIVLVAIILLLGAEWVGRRLVRLS